MDGSATAYSDLLRRIEDRFPEIAQQIREEVVRGKPVRIQGFSADRLEREERLAEVGLGKIAKSDVSVEPYSGDEQLLILLGAVHTLVREMATTRLAVTTDWTIGLVSPNTVEFADPGEAGEETRYARDRAINEHRQLQAIASTLDSLILSVKAES